MALGKRGIKSNTMKREVQINIDDVLFDNIGRQESQRGNLLLRTLVNSKKESFNSEQHFNLGEQHIVQGIVNVMKDKLRPSRFLTWNKISREWVYLENSDLESRIFLMLRGYWKESYDDLNLDQKTIKLKDQVFNKKFLYVKDSGSITSEISNHTSDTSDIFSFLSEDSSCASGGEISNFTSVFSCSAELEEFFQLI
mmetsp:Transcript_21113/g.47867  ORF Transcript_21113/g.47867 Transcript_21113/m.47867 type:complete len:197 (-) Transcript_21113:131-721(-)